MATASSGRRREKKDHLTRDSFGCDPNNPSSGEENGDGLSSLRTSSPSTVARRVVVNPYKDGAEGDDEGCVTEESIVQMCWSCISSCGGPRTRSPWGSPKPQIRLHHGAAIRKKRRRELPILPSIGCMIGFGILGASLATWKYFNMGGIVAGIFNLHLYENRAEYFFVLGPRSPLSMFLHMVNPMVDPYSRAVLWDRFLTSPGTNTNHQHYLGLGHRGRVEQYDAHRHDTDHRKLHTNVTTASECATLRDAISRAVHLHRRENEFGDKALGQELGEVPLIDLLRSYTTSEERALLFEVLCRVQTRVEESFNDPDMYIEFGSATVRENVIPTDRNWKSFLQQWWFSTSSGHGIHADQCRIDTSRFDAATMGEEGREVHRKVPWILTRLGISPPIDVGIERSMWNHDFECTLDTNVCCHDRTHSALLYLDDPIERLHGSGGGQLYLLDRRDFSHIDHGRPDRATTEGASNDTLPKYRGAPLSIQAQRVLLVEPMCGNLVTFASDARNLHGTVPLNVGSGKRMALPMWFTSQKNLPPLESLHQGTEDAYRDLDIKAREVCQRAVDATQGGRSNFPPPSGLAVEHHGMCKSWLEQLRDPMTLIPHRDGVAR